MGKDGLEALNGFVLADGLLSYARTGAKNALERHLACFALHQAFLELLLRKFKILHHEEHRLAHDVLQVTRDGGGDVESAVAETASTDIAGTVR